MDEVRLIHYGDDSGKERLFFTEEMDMDVSEILPKGWKVISDQKIEMSTNGFPLEHEMEKR